MNALHPQLTGQPVLIGGTMGTCSYVLTGTEQGMTETFGTTCHGAVSQEIISGRGWNETVIQRTKLLKGHPICDASVSHTSRESSLGSSPCPGELQGRSLCPLLSSCD